MRIPAAAQRVDSERAAEKQPRSRWRRVLWTLLGIAGVLLVVLAAAWVMAPRVDLASIVGGRASARLGRAVSFGGVHVRPGRWLLVEVTEAKVANLEGGSRPSMVEVAAVSAEVEALPLLRGTVVLRKLTVDGLDVLLEHVGDRPNWRFGADAEPAVPREVTANRRPWLPTILEARVVGDVQVRTLSGATLPIELNGVTIATAGVAEPVKLAGPGSYKGVPITLDTTLGSFNAYRDASTPFPTDIRMNSGDTALRFEGTMTAPLDVNGAVGRLSLAAPSLEVIERVAGLAASGGPAVRVEGAFTHEGPSWRLTEASGSVGEQAFTEGTLTLEEGRPDAVTVAAAFEQLDLDALLGERGRGKGADVSLKVEQGPRTVVAATISASGATYAGVKLSEVSLRISQRPGKLVIDALALTYAGGKMEAKGEIDAAAEGGRLGGEVTATGMDVQALRAVLEMGRLPLSGRINGHAVVQASGATLNQAMRSLRGTVALTMGGGAIAKEVVELASTDARTLFRTAKGTSAISCALGVMEIRAGVGTVSPLRVRTSDGTIVGRGTVDLVRHRVDLTILSESRTTGAFALDVPVRVSGPFADPSAVPARLSAAGRAQIAALDEGSRLPASVQGVVRRSACAGRQ